MYHTIEFLDDLWVDVDRSPRHRLERVFLRSGARACVELRPHVIETPAGPVEAADLFFPDGTAARDVPFATFRFPQ